MTHVKISGKKDAVDDFVRLRFRKHTKALADAVMSKSSFVRYGRQEVLFAQGENSAHCCFLVNGLVRLNRIREDGREITIKYIFPGELSDSGIVVTKSLFGAMTLENSEILMVERDCIKKLIMADSELLENQLQRCALDMVHLVGLIESHALNGTRERLCAYLEQFSKRERNRRFRLPVPRCELAVLLGSTPENLSRVIKQMTKDGCLTIKGREVQLNF
ncbi:Crp/Fnr family transcriptional regulator [Seleniivibrio sp.]|uniref:Crp/Fnr family transcriptional regulator n=1 Tax=Seleniivibrio sp. TaxID=2898801 RepID=UPI0025E5E218|nr:Crp/Fnr family transcriptional regulator [Seleniivibrio sp.]MCD8552610.1 Crp/Fnr family transcriptional regulator [Seleniivibrio sp.]